MKKETVVKIPKNQHYVIINYHLLNINTWLSDHGYIPNEESRNNFREWLASFPQAGLHNNL